MPKISVIVPVYKVEKYLSRCIDSILAQTFSDFELILVDDGSPDNCPQICDDYAKKDSRIKVIHKKNGGVSSARNVGLDNAQGEYISFVDPDDVVFYDYYKKMIENIGNGDFIFCDFIRFSDSCIFDDKVEFDTVIYEKKEVYSCVYYWSAINPIWNKLIKKDIISNLRFDINLKNAEDTLFNFQLLKRCNKVVYIKTELYGYCMRNDGAVGLMDLKGKKDVVEAYQKIYNFREISENKQLHRFWNTKLCYAYIILFFEFLDKNEKNNADFKNCKKYLIKNLYSILFFNNMLNHKEKILLLIKLFLY